MKLQLPAPFEPRLHSGSAIAGICLIRLEQIRPTGLPAIFGVSSENAAHRVAVRWTSEAGEEKEGVFIPRRDSGSVINQVVGGRLFPGEHHSATFSVNDTPDSIDVQMESEDGRVSVRVTGTVAPALSATSHFSDLEEASDFFERGSLGYSATREGRRLEGLHLHTRTWQVSPLEVGDVFSSYFSNTSMFPKGSVEFDCALLMRNIEHEWYGADDLYLYG